MPRRRHEVPERRLGVGVELDLGVGRLGMEVPHWIAGDVGAHEPLDDAQKLIARPQIGDGRLHDAAQVDQERGPWVVALERRHPRVQALIGVFVRDPSGGVQTLGRLIDDALDCVQNRLKLGPGEQIFDDQKAIVEIALYVFVADCHLTLLASPLGVGPDHSGHG